MGVSVKYKKSEKKKLTKELCELYSDVDKKLTLERCCKRVGIDQKTFYNWRKEHKDLEEAFQTALKIRLDCQRQIDEDIFNRSRTKLIEGQKLKTVKKRYIYKEEIDENTATIKRVKVPISEDVQVKEVGPNAYYIRFLEENKFTGSAGESDSNKTVVVFSDGTEVEL